MVLNKINILLIDDNPRFFRRDDDIPDVKLSLKYRDHFYLHWIKTYPEARFVLESYEEIYKHAPQDVLTLGLPPEILIFDYDLSAPDGDKKKNPRQSSNLSEKIKSYLQGSTINVPPPLITEAEEKSDKIGCYVGIQFSNVFHNYPCGFTPTTAHVNTSGTDAEAIESLNDKNLNGAFAHKNRLAPTWEQLINYGIDKFRNKIIDLINANLIKIPSAELYSLVRDPGKDKTKYISIYSKLGLRMIPTAGLFIDADDEQNYEQLAKEWAIQALKISYKNGDFLKAKEITDLYFKSFYEPPNISKTRQLRENLSNLASRFPDEKIDNLTAEEKNELTTLCHRFGINLCDVIKNPKNVKIRNDSLPVWKQYQKINDSIARWVVLMLIVRAEQYTRQYQTKETILVNDVFKLLNPLPDSLLIDETNNTASQAVQRLELSIYNVLRQKSQKGLVHGEGYLLKLYANEIGFNENLPLWLQEAP